MRPLCRRAERLWPPAAARRAYRRARWWSCVCCSVWQLFFSRCRAFMQWRCRRQGGWRATCGGGREGKWWGRVKLRAQLCDAPGASGGGGNGRFYAERPAACAGSLETVCTGVDMDTGVGKRKTRRGMLKESFVVIGLLSHVATAQKQSNKLAILHSIRGGGRRPV